MWGLHYHFPRAIQSHGLALIAMMLFLAAYFCINSLTHLAMAKSPVSNVESPSLLEVRSLPHLIQQDRNSESLIRFRRNLEEIPEKEYPNSLSKAVAIRHWVRRQQPEDKFMWMPAGGGDHENPQRLLEEQRQGVPGACRRFSYILLGALLSAGFDARIVCFVSSLRRRGMKSHVAVEAWIEELAQWVLLDPTYDTVVLVDGKVASAFELHKAAAAGRLDRITFDRNGTTVEPHPSPEHFGLYCQHLFVATSNAVFDGYYVRMIGTRRIPFLHYSEASAYPVLRKRVLLNVGGAGLCLSAIFWAWTLLSLATA
jgi:hypothetical protein